ncbi:polymorphic toxin-type HINT domain-containing protein [Kitasatospora sp. NPDC058218]|uniref:polymorphic toxin-type HINT domain-containing protein n=1 Tax=Kitasatospora sp. NPDC058218 TaxID=3346385 RepID=UPI0036DB1F68
MVSLRVLPLALAAGLLGAVPAMAADTTGATTPVVSMDRARVVALWQAGGPAIKATAEAALTGSDADVRKFLDIERVPAQVQDDQVSAAQILTLGGAGVREAARKALAGTPEELRAFLDGGYQEALKSDQQVRAASLINGAGAGVQAAARAALNGTPDDVQVFLNDGQYTARDTDDRVKLVQILATGGPNTQAAARLALNGTIDDVREFLEVGQHVAKARDVEHTSVEQLTQQAKEASAQAVRETEDAKESAAQAIAASQLAKESAAKAAAETEAARNDTVAATAAAGRAADAANRATDAAQTAVKAARSATNSARTAASAASQAAYAAAGAARAATAARNAAAGAATDRAKADAATAAATTAENAAKAADAASGSLTQATAAASASAEVAESALSASGNAMAAATAAGQAGGYAGVAGSQSARAKAAAAATQRQAQEASRAATAAKSLAGEAAQATAQAKVLADSAATHARNAAAAARDAAQHAGEAAQAADRSKAHAEAAVAAAQTAKDAVDEANRVHDVAQRAEAEDLAAQTATDVERVKAAKAAYDDKQAAIGEGVQQLRRTKDEATRLATALAQANPDTAAIATDGRKLAVLSMKIAGPWEVAAARTALSGTDQDVLDFVRDGRRRAIEMDDRDRVQNLATTSELPAVRAAAAQALQGDANAVTAYLTTGQYQAATPDFQVSVAKIVSTGGSTVQAAGRAALNGNVEALRDFLTSGRYLAQLADDQVVAAGLRQSGGPEVKAAAQIALEGTPEVLRAFIETGQYTTARKDALAATHVAEIQRMISEASAVTAYAQQSAAEAVQAAALARNASGEADVASAQAGAAASAAAGYAAEAKNKADAAAVSAKKAADAAKTAASAEASARHSAASASYSAQQAQRSAASASWSAQEAYASAARAKADAEAAGQDTAVAAQAARNAMDTYKTKYVAEQEAARVAAAQAANDAAAKQQAEQDKKSATDTLEAELRKEAAQHKSGWLDTVLNVTHGVLDLIGGVGGVFAPGIADIADLINCGIYALQKDVENAILSCVGAIPLAGDAAAVAKLAKWAEKIPGGKKVMEFLDKLFSKLPGSCPIGRNSFPAGTRVLMADGSTKPIEQVRVGDQVLSGDPAAGQTGARRVDATIYTPDDRDFTDLVVQTGAKAGTLTATDHHPFWSENRQNWVDAADLQVGDQVRTASGATATVSDVRHRTTLQPAYNLSVSDLHTYYVLAGETSVLVHNSQKCPDLGESWTAAPKSTIAGSTGCEACALEILGKLGGGEVLQIAPQVVNRYSKLPYQGVEDVWYVHYAVLKDGKVFDKWTGRNGVPQDEYLKRFYDSVGQYPITSRRGSLKANPSSGGGYTFTPSGG